MGLTLTTLHTRKEAAAIAPLLSSSEVLRTHSPGWTTILPGPADDGGYAALQKLAQKLPGA